ncbi:Asp-tRNA(Asn)/Glu-tRNA(Gln) amidotransferase subunit GatC [Pseudonocardia sp. S2-4]|uniref:Aspartyl/glutamyl-tRNA(Asn/Gln) amidotransferase subunit C n=1 Tax=Pseudonocardia humida TaxID=2800819 RepID=A0ABT1ABE0_9PSEU|nr:Asp-tRNA(Asn)/Glu-tRNA(Gln) amidotransferase subunit GatC [Pseudonocardia humida]
MACPSRDPTGRPPIAGSCPSRLEDFLSSTEGPADTSGLTRDEVAHLARLARLAVTDDELDVLAGQLEVILGAVASVGEVAADDIPPMSHAVPLENVFRADERRPGLSQQQALAGAPAAEDGRFRVPRILGEEA